ncbi:fructokinase [Lapidilactobacillus dextrinicus DSM 20335]|uniref:Fructokinase n=1 Tax=Lapidilactobacillus dextrinicus DSM 20335 TaxID=1423738 RepID=A0A0R2BR13_9LACO|nr:fructokinase ScrK [Lapidilactobacillus dextrinicus]KRM78619.1 fructokinase [Lapidilactobacillus dextrinicus DSM 20335]QFG46544.1 ROK family protein [Lapidilactobacillus dextrinicus]
MLYGSIEAGGTKFVCAVGNEDFQTQNQVQFPTTTPEETLKRVIAYFNNFDLAAIGIASFGPIEIRPNNEKYGYITNTPKLAWQDTDFVGIIRRTLNVPIAWTTDVNGSAYGEFVYANQQGKPLKSLVYYTIGTGVGAGVIDNGNFVGTLGHPEMGHVFVKRHPDDMSFKGICPFHNDCLEGLVAGPTFEARTGKNGRDVPATDPIWQIMAYYTAQAAVQTTLTLRPNKIIFGGGVANESFLNQVRTEFDALLNNYVPTPILTDYLTVPAIANNGSATIGNFALAQNKYKNSINEL